MYANIGFRILFSPGDSAKRTSPSIGGLVASFADVLMAFISAHQRLLYRVWNSFPENWPITANFAYFGKLAFDLYDLRANVSINMSDIEVGFVNVCEKFGIRALNDYQRKAITQFVNNMGIAHWFSQEIWAGSRYRFLKALMIGLLRDNGERNFILRRADVGGRE